MCSITLPNSRSLLIGCYIKGLAASHWPALPHRCRVVGKLLSVFLFSVRRLEPAALSRSSEWRHHHHPSCFIFFIFPPCRFLLLLLRKVTLSVLQCCPVPTRWRDPSPDVFPPSQHSRRLPPCASVLCVSFPLWFQLWIFCQFLLSEAYVAILAGVLITNMSWFYYCRPSWYLSLVAIPLQNEQTVALPAKNVEITRQLGFSFSFTGSALVLPGTVPSSRSSRKLV